MGARVLLAVTGGIAAYRSVELLRLLQQAGYDVRVMQTRASLAFVGAATFAALTGAPTITDEQSEGGHFPHLDAGRDAELLVVAPATAASLARMASAQADDVLGATYLAFDGPVVVAPAMNVRMWEHPATKRNVEQLCSDGVLVVEPEAGVLACGDIGAGRLAPVEEIARAVQQALGGDDAGGPLAADDLAGRVVVVTAGGTREPIDAVRSITNRSSGRMGLELARAALARGATVRLIITATVEPALYADLNPVAVVERASDLRAALAEHVGGSDVVVMAAAVSDFTPVTKLDVKLERGDALELRLDPVPDLIAEVAAQRGGAGGSPLIVAFAAEAGEGGIERAAAKRERKGVDLIVHNDISRTDIGFEVDCNEVTIIGPGSHQRVGPAPKREIAEQILHAVVGVIRSGSASAAFEG